MKFPSLVRAKPASPLDAVGVSPSAAATDTHLSNGSTLADGEKKEVFTDSPTSSQASHHGSEIGDLPLEKVKTLEQYSDEPAYPSGIKLTIITFSLCISVFCMALVRLRLHYDHRCVLLNSSKGQHDYRHCHPENYRPFRGSGRCRVVWIL